MSDAISDAFRAAVPTLDDLRALEREAREALREFVALAGDVNATREALHAAIDRVDATSSRLSAQADRTAVAALGALHTVAMLTRKGKLAEADASAETASLGETMQAAQGLSLQVSNDVVAEYKKVESSPVFRGLMMLRNGRGGGDA